MESLQIYQELGRAVDELYQEFLSGLLRRNNTSSQNYSALALLLRDLGTSQVMRHLKKRSAEDSRLNNVPITWLRYALFISKYSKQGLSGSIDYWLGTPIKLDGLLEATIPIDDPNIVNKLLPISRVRRTILTLRDISMLYNAQQREC